MRKKTFNTTSTRAIDGYHKEPVKWCDGDFYLYSIITRDAMDESQLKQYNKTRRGL